jgi:hypothetical protein
MVLKASAHQKHDTAYASAFHCCFNVIDKVGLLHSLATENELDHTEVSHLFSDIFL